MLTYYRSTITIISQYYWYTDNTIYCFCYANNTYNTIYCSKNKLLRRRSTTVSFDEGHSPKYQEFRRQYYIDEVKGGQAFRQSGIRAFGPVGHLGIWLFDVWAFSFRQSGPRVRTVGGRSESRAFGAFRHTSIRAVGQTKSRACLAEKKSSTREIWQSGTGSECFNRSSSRPERN
jgi:hypothetical protein